jgi:OOP family OmpA-OmpF porin
MHLSFVGFIGVALCACMVLGVQAQTKSKYGVQQPQGGAYVAVPSVSPEQARIVIYRNDAAPHAGVASLYIDARYHASLQAKAFTVLCLPPAKHVLQAHQPDADEPTPQPRLPIVAFAGQSHYVRVVAQADAPPQLRRVAQPQAEADMAPLHQQMHTLSRVPQAKPCKQNSTSASQQVPEVITHATELWFEDSQAQSKPVVDKKRIELDQLLDKLSSRQQHQMLHSIHIVGHGDQGLSTAKNEHLAKARAQTVREQLLAQGVDADIITHEWRSQAPLNRRVEVEVLYESNAQNEHLNVQK